MNATGPADARALVAAKRSADDAIGTVLVHVDRTGLESFCNLHGATNVARPDRRAETILGSVGERQRFLDVAEAQNRQHWTEDLFLGDPHRRLDVVKQGR